MEEFVYLKVKKENVKDIEPLKIVEQFNTIEDLINCENYDYVYHDYKSLISDYYSNFYEEDLLDMGYSKEQIDIIYNLNEESYTRIVEDMENDSNLNSELDECIVYYTKTEVNRILESREENE